MKLRLYIIILSLLILTAFTYGTNYSILNPSVKTSQKKIDKNVLCLNISLVSVDYIDSLIVSDISSGKIISKVFIFTPKTRRISVECFYNLSEIKNRDLKFYIYKSGKEYKYKGSLLF